MKMTEVESKKRRKRNSSMPLIFFGLKNGKYRAACSNFLFLKRTNINIKKSKFSVP